MQLSLGHARLCLVRIALLLRQKEKVWEGDTLALPSSVTPVRYIRIGLPSDTPPSPVPFIASLHSLVFLAETVTPADPDDPYNEQNVKFGRFREPPIQQATTHRTHDES